MTFGYPYRWRFEQAIHPLLQFKEHTTQKQSESAKPARNLFVQLVSLQNGPPPGVVLQFFYTGYNKIRNRNGVS